jgi:hypothetical protein
MVPAGSSHIYGQSKYGCVIIVKDDNKILILQVHTTKTMCRMLPQRGDETFTGMSNVEVPRGKTRVFVI